MVYYFKTTTFADQQSLQICYQEGNQTEGPSGKFHFEGLDTLECMKICTQDELTDEVWLNLIDHIEAYPIETHAGVDYYTTEQLPLIIVETIIFHAFFATYFTLLQESAESLLSASVDTLFNFCNSSDVFNDERQIVWHPFVLKGCVIPLEEAWALRHQDWCCEPAFAIKFKIPEKGCTPNPINFLRSDITYIRPDITLPEYTISYHLL